MSRCLISQGIALDQCPLEPSEAVVVVQECCMCLWGTVGFLCGCKLYGDQDTLQHFRSL